MHTLYSSPFLFLYVAMSVTYTSYIYVVEPLCRTKAGADPGISERGGLYTINECHLFMSLVIPEPDTTFAKCTLSFHNLTSSRMVKVK